MVFAVVFDPNATKCIFALVMEFFKVLDNINSVVALLRVYITEGVYLNSLGHVLSPAPPRPFSRT